MDRLLKATSDNRSTKESKERYCLLLSKLFWTSNSRGLINVLMYKFDIPKVVGFCELYIFLSVVVRFFVTLPDDSKELIDI